MNTDNRNTSDIPSEYTVASLGAMIRARLEPRFGNREAEQMVRIIWQWLLGWRTTDIALKQDKVVSLYVEQKFEAIAARLIAGEPLQYILGEAYFYGSTFKVTPATLIPRPETAELVDMIVDRYKGCSDLSILDIGTGSGCIAISLARNLPFAKVTATDISKDALSVARENALSLKAKVDFIQSDILTTPPQQSSQFDIIVSNPPYIAEHERVDMDKMVSGHEPSMALFVPDSNPLLFYKAILNYATDALKSSGMVFFEINPLFANELLKYIDGLGIWIDTTLSRDMHGRVRFLHATHK